MNKVNVPQLRFPEFDGEWEIESLKDISKIERGRFSPRPRNNPIYYNGEIPFVQTSDVVNANGKIEFFTQTLNKKGLAVSKLFPKGSILITIAANIGHCGVLQIDMACPDSLIGIKPNKNIDNYYLNYYLATHQKKMDYLAPEGAQKNINIEFLNPYKIPFPTLPEQQKIASFLSAVDEKIQQLSRKKELVEQYKKGVMQQLFSSTSSEQRSGKLRFKDDNGNDYPDWEEKKLGEVARITTGSSNRQDSNLDGEYTFFDRSQDIRSSNIFLFDTEAIIVPGEGQEFVPKYFIGKFDLHQRTYAVMEFGNNIGKFLYYYIGYNSNHLNSHAVGSTVKSLRLPMFQKMPIKLPVLEEQQKIANFLSNIDVKIENTNQEIKQMQHFKKGLLQQMFV